MSCTYVLGVARPDHATLYIQVYSETMVQHGLLAIGRALLSHTRSQ